MLTKFVLLVSWMANDFQHLEMLPRNARLLMLVPQLYKSLHWAADLVPSVVPSVTNNSIVKLTWFSCSGVITLSAHHYLGQ